MAIIAAAVRFLTRPLNSFRIMRCVSQGGDFNNKKPRPSTESLIRWDKMPIPKKQAKDRWTEKRALFGENDYKDILGDGTYNLKYNVKTGPLWLRGWSGNELQRLIRKNKVMGLDMGPVKRYEMLKRIRFLHKQMNKNKGKWMYRDSVSNYRDRM